MFYVTTADHPEPEPGAWVTPGFMQGLGIAAEVDVPLPIRNSEPAIRRLR